MRLPDSWLIEYERYKQREFANNTGIYDHLTNEQRKAVEQYFRWKTRMQFKRMFKDTRLERKPEKAKVLADLMGDIDDWEYGGCWDTGRIGGGHCALGHALRYQHFAVSPSTGKEIEFGVQCASDFFDIDPAILRKINAIQDETLDEIKTSAFIKYTNKNNVYVDMFYSDMSKVFDVLGDNRDEVFGGEWITHMRNFTLSRMPWTKSMVERYEYIKKTKYLEKQVELSNRQCVLDFISNKGEKYVGYVKEALEANHEYGKRVASYVAEYSALKPEWCTKLIERALNYSDAYKVMKGSRIKDIKGFANSGKIIEIWVHAKNGDRIATKKEAENYSPNRFENVIYPLGEEVYQYMQILAWGENGAVKFLKEAGFSPEKENNAHKELEKTYDKMSNAIAWVFGISFKNNVLALASRIKKKNEYLDSAEDEEVEIASIEDMAIAIIQHFHKPKEGSFEAVAHDIASKLIYKKYKLSDAQRNVILKAYSSITGNQQKESGKEDNAHKEILRKAQYIKDNADRVKNSTGDYKLKSSVKFGESVATTILGYKGGRTPSEKQCNVIEDVYEKIRKFISEEEAINSRERANQIFIDEPSEGYGTSTEERQEPSENSEQSGQNGLGYNPDIFDDQDSQRDDLGYDYGKLYDGEEEYDAFDEGYNSNYVSEPTRTDCLLHNIPSIVDISEALGHGVFLEAMEKSKNTESEQ